MTHIRGQLLDMLRSVAVALGKDMRERLVFVGGCATVLYLTDPVTVSDVRATNDVDLIVNLAGFSQWNSLLETLRDRGFAEAPEEDVICRLRLGTLNVDFMPDDSAILGFTNRWSGRGMATAVKIPLDADIEIRILTPVLFLATKIEAFLGRGNGDLLSSRDAEDILLVVDGRESLAEEVRTAEPDIAGYIRAGMAGIIEHRDFEDFLHGNIRGPAGRVAIVRERLISLVDGAGFRA